MKNYRSVYATALVTLMCTALLSGGCCSCSSDHGESATRSCTPACPSSLGTITPSGNAFTVDLEAVKARIQEDPDYSGCYYRSYPAPDNAERAEMAAMVPSGYEPFYITHYGRHGSRWVSDQEVYDRASAFMEAAAQEKVLTRTGKALLKDIRIICQDGDLRGGDLSPKGAEEHKGIAKRMYENYPQVFAARDGKAAEVSCVSTLKPRCILSMAAFNEGLKEMNPEIGLTRAASKHDTYYLHNYEYTDDIYKASEAAGDSLVRVYLEPGRFLSSLISDPQYLEKKVQDPDGVMFDFFHLASDMQCVDYLNIDLYHYFTEEELYQCWRALNAHTYMTEGPSFRYGDPIMANAKNLVAHFVSAADEVLAGKCDHAATLRFGHESNIVPFMALIGVKSVASRTTAEEAEHCWNTSEICPMATNMQLVFFRKIHENESMNSEKRAGRNQPEIIVRVLHNERDAELPLDGGPFYDWKALRKYLLQKAAK